MYVDYDEYEEFIAVPIDNNEQMICNPDAPNIHITYEGVVMIINQVGSSIMDIEIKE